MTGNSESTGPSPRSHVERLFDALNQPIVVTIVGGLLVFAVSNEIQNRYWLRQQSYLLDQARVDQTWAASRSAQEEIVRALGKRLAASASVISAHSLQYNLTQHRKTVDHYNEALEEWEVSNEIVKFQLAAYFDDQRILDQWKSVNFALEQLHSDISDLEEYVPADASTKQDDQISKCNQKIDEIDEQIKTLNRMMHQFAANGGKKSGQ